jgi:hypothetical protein
LGSDAATEEAPDFFQTEGRADTSCFNDGGARLV